MIRIAAEYTFEAAHHLPHVDDGHKCKRMHGHNYRVEVSITGNIDHRGFVMDYAELDAIVNPLIEQLDHRCLNDIAGLENPTSEELALWLKARIVSSLPPRSNLIVRLWETPRYWCEVF